MGRFRERAGERVSQEAGPSLGSPEHGELNFRSTDGRGGLSQEGRGVGVGGG